MLLAVLRVAGRLPRVGAWVAVIRGRGRPLVMLVCRSPDHPVPPKFLPSHTNYVHPTPTTAWPPQIKCDGESVVVSASVDGARRPPRRRSLGRNRKPSKRSHLNARLRSESRLTDPPHTGKLPCSTCFLRCRPCRPKRQSGSPLMECILSRMDPMEVASVYKEVRTCMPCCCRRPLRTCLLVECSTIDQYPLNTRSTTRTTLQQYLRRSTWSCARASSTATRPFSTCKFLRTCARLYRTRRFHAHHDSTFDMTHTRREWAAMNTIVGSDVSWCASIEACLHNASQ